MAWARIDDGMADHPKVIMAGPLAELVAYRALQYANRYLTDGFIPFDAIFTLASRLDRVYAEPVEHLADILVDVGIWNRADGGWVIHDYLQYNRSREWVEANRRRSQEGGRRSAEVRAQRGEDAARTGSGEGRVASRVASRVAARVDQAISHAPSQEASSETLFPSASPEGVSRPPEPATPEPPTGTPRRRKKAPDIGPEFARFWAAYPRHIDKQLARRAWTKLAPSADLAEAIIAAAPLHAAYWDATARPADKIPYPSTWLNGRRWEDELDPTATAPPRRARPEPDDPYKDFPRF